MTIDEAIERYKNNAEYERTHGNLQGCLEFRQLAKWLEKYKKIENRYKKFKNIGHFEQMAWLDCMTDIEEVINGYDD